MKYLVMVKKEVSMMLFVNEEADFDDMAIFDDSEEADLVVQP